MYATYVERGIVVPSRNHF